MTDADTQNAMAAVLEDLKLQSPKDDTDDNANTPEADDQNQPASHETSSMDGSVGSSNQDVADTSLTNQASPPPVMRQHQAPVPMEPDYGAKGTMDQCIDTIRVSGKSSLHSEDPLARLDITSQKPAALDRLMDLLGIQQDRIAHDEHRKYILLRDSSTSYVYLAAAQ